MKINYQDGLLFVSLTLTYQGRTHTINRVVLDTGAAQSLIDRDAVEPLLLKPALSDEIVTMMGIGGSESALRKRIDPNTPDTLFLIGAATLWNGNPSSYEFDGDVANVQLYDTALSANAISALYDEGIGGAPINLQSLVGWWPLNGNTQDYSGNGYKGQISGTVTFTNQWASGYRAP